MIKPVAAAEREIFMDVLRGIAILGIFIANLNGFSWYFPDPENTGPWLLPEQDKTMAFLHHMFIEGKFYSIFSLLFGWGIALQLKRASDKGIDAVSFVKRRLRWMLLFGAVHLMIWPGDIVFFYALLGFLLLPMRKLSDMALILTGSVLILSPIALYAAKSYWPELNLPVGILFETGTYLQGAITGVPLSTNEEFAAYLKNAGFGYIGEVGPVYYTLFGVLVFAGQVILSHWWLRYFNYGPVEYLWRSATYKKCQPMKKG